MNLECFIFWLQHLLLNEPGLNLFFFFGDNNATKQTFRVFFRYNTAIKLTLHAFLFGYNTATKRTLSACFFGCNTAIKRTIHFFFW